MKKLQERTDLVADMASVMRQAIDIDDRNANEFNEKMNQLVIENNGLRELLIINMKYGPKDMLDAKTSTKHDKEVQTQFDEEKAPVQKTDCNSQTIEQPVEQSTTEIDVETEKMTQTDQAAENNNS